jgi:hypothetical protein
VREQKNDYSGKKKPCFLSFSLTKIEKEKISFLGGVSVLYLGFGKKKSNGKNDF